MYLLRRVAARALSQQPSWQLSTIAPQTTRVTTPRLNSFRQFHRTRLCLIEEDVKKAEGSPAQVEPTDGEANQKAAAHDAVAEASGTTAQDAGPALNTSSYDANEMPSVTAHDRGGEGEGQTLTGRSREASAFIGERAAEMASSAAQTVQSAIGSSAQAAYDSAARHIPGRANEVSARSQAPTALPQGRNSSGSTNPPSRILYVGNLFFEVTIPQLEAEFSRYGTILNSRVVTDDRGLSKGFAYIEFADQDSADQAMRELDQKILAGRRMAVQYHLPRQTRSATQPHTREPALPSKTLFIGNMSYQMSDRDLNDLFREIRNVLDVRVAVDRRTGQPRGFAHADFIDIEAAQKAKQHLEQKVIYGRQLKVDFSASSPFKRGVVEESS